eukprot:TRINITY_DN8240_c0_g1_i2.p1 TRINITY_DN8240_c0_g1~~TRINITY_DN8240_c0_g1_i2.p1  ORF type:complete len:342 (+),score=59.34 TRINITY_DN8240_c0_g1_i2:190-1215(+)
MPKLPTSRLGESRSRCRPMPSKLDKFIDNPAHTQSLSLTLGQSAAGTEGMESTVSFWRSNSRIRDSKVNPVVVPVRPEPDDGLPIMSHASNGRFVTDNLQSHAPPVPADGKEYILEPEKFAYGFVEPPKYRLVMQQGKAGTLQRPAQRQQRALQVKLGQLADKQLHGDNAKEARLKQKMLWEYKRGALGVEGVSSEGSEIYNGLQSDICNKQWDQRQREELKMGNLLGNLSRVQYQMYDPLKDGAEAGPYTGPDKWFQNKGRVSGQSSFTQSTKTHDIRAVPASRTTNIRNCNTKGRQYNILSGAQLEDVPPTIPETYEAKHLRSIHPSMNRHNGSSFRIE